MSPIDVHLMKIEDVISKMDDFLDDLRGVPFSSKVSVDKRQIYEIMDELRPILEEIRKDLPQEIVNAKWVISNNEKMTTDARNKAAAVMNSAEVEAERLTGEHEITLRAQELAARILEDAKRDARELRLNAKEYADELLEKADEHLQRAKDDFTSNARKIEKFFQETLDTVYENRQELRDKEQG